jgi:SAM-dependent methyltransferase
MAIRDTRPEPADDVQEMYARTPEGTRPAFQEDKSKALGYYRDFVDFVRSVASVDAFENRKPHILDVGCGCGWSSYAFALAGYRATGIDLNAAAFEPPATPDLTLQEASATDLPFADDTFDIVATYQCIEHVPDPEAALREMARVCRPGGFVCIVGPNLVSPAFPLRWVVNTLLGKEKILLRRTATTPRHPYGNTLPENLVSIPVTTVRLLRKLVAPNPTFTLRAPDTVPPFHSDNDACYLCNPVDFLKYFPKHGFAVRQTGKPGRPPLSYLVAGGTWIAAQKLEPRSPQVTDGAP